MAADRAAIRNRLLTLLADDDFALLAPHLEPVALVSDDLLIHPDTPVADVFFPDSGLLSLVAVSPEQQRVEAGMIGLEGFSPTALALHADRIPYELTVQGTGKGHRIPVEPFRRAIAQSRSLHGLLLRFVQVFSVQIGYTALSNAVHPIDERLARWLLMCHDRLQESAMTLTHEFLSLMLAVRRPSVTTSLHVLEGNRFIRAERSTVIIRDRAALEQFAGDAYGIPEAAYRELIG